MPGIYMILTSIYGTLAGYLQVSPVLIPGTQVSPFMLRLGHHPILPEDLKVGEFVLWHGPRRKNKLQFQWHGPYRVKEKVNDVKYIVEDPLDGTTRKGSMSI